MVKAKNVSVDYEYHNADNLDFHKPSDTDLAWLAGIIDGEGSITFQVTKRKTGNLVIVPFISVTNTDEGIIQRIMDILDNIGVGFKASWIIDKNHPKYLKRCNIKIDRYARVKGFIPMVYPYLSSVKKYNAEVVLDFIKNREENLFTRDKKGRIVRNKYPKALVEKISSVRKHVKAMPLEEMLKAPNVC